MWFFSFVELWGFWLRSICWTWMWPIVAIVSWKLTWSAFFEKYKPIADDIDVKSLLYGHLLGCFMFDCLLNTT